jgi:hypothetical protein
MIFHVCTDKTKDTTHVCVHKSRQLGMCAQYGPRTFCVYNTDQVYHVHTSVSSTLVCMMYPRGDIHQQFANKVREMFTYVQYCVRQCIGWGRGEAAIPSAAPTPLTLPYTLLYICTVREQTSRTVGEYGLRPPCGTKRTTDTTYVHTVYVLHTRIQYTLCTQN